MKKDIENIYKKQSKSEIVTIVKTFSKFKTKIMNAIKRRMDTVQKSKHENPNTKILLVFFLKN